MNVLIFTNSGYFKNNFGYAVVGSNLSKGLAKLGYNVFYCGMQSIHPPFVDDGITYLGVRFDAFGGDILRDYIRVYKIDIIITIVDIFVAPFHYINTMVKELDIPWICHITINSYPLSPNLANQVANANFIVAPSDFNYQTLADAGYSESTRLIYHGCDLEVFKPNNDVEEIKKKLKIEDKKFIALCVARNKGMQKNFAQLFKSWKMFLESNHTAKEDAVLLILSDPLEPEGMRLDILRQRSGMIDNVKFICVKPEGNGITFTYEGDGEGLLHNANLNFSSEVMAQLYNACDVFITASCGESFCLPIVESMACGKPTIAGNFGATQDHVKNSGAGKLVKISLLATTPIFSDVAYYDESDFANQIEFMYKYPEQRKSMGLKGIEYAKSFDWNKIIPKWDEAIKECAGYKQNLNYPKGLLGV